MRQTRPLLLHCAAVLAPARHYRYLGPNKLCQEASSKANSIPQRVENHMQLVPAIDKHNTNTAARLAVYLGQLTVPGTELNALPLQCSSVKLPHIHTHTASVLQRKTLAATPLQLPVTHYDRLPATPAPSLPIRPTSPQHLHNDHRLAHSLMHGVHACVYTASALSNNLPPLPHHSSTTVSSRAELNDPNTLAVTLSKCS